MSRCASGKVVSSACDVCLCIFCVFVPLRYVVQQTATCLTPSPSAQYDYGGHCSGELWINFEHRGYVPNAPYGGVVALCCHQNVAVVHGILSCAIRLSSAMPKPLRHHDF